MTSACGSQVEEEARTRTDAGSPCTRLTCTWPSPTPTSRATRHRAPCQPDNKTWGRNQLSERLAQTCGEEKLRYPPPLRFECARGCGRVAVGRASARAHTSPNESDGFSLGAKRRSWRTSCGPSGFLVFSMVFFGAIVFSCFCEGKQAVCQISEGPTRWAVMRAALLFEWPRRGALHREKHVVWWRRGVIRDACAGQLRRMSVTESAKMSGAASTSALPLRPSSRLSGRWKTLASIH